MCASRRRAGTPDAPALGAFMRKRFSGGALRAARDETANHLVTNGAVNMSKRCA